ncbi:MAG TPA: TlpA disulfide reductase family protein [Bryobacteraceae bacterium]|nr:TlpA disulfide reductase family protein [Bryobacteraceae bacterium]
MSRLRLTAALAGVLLGFLLGSCSSAPRPARAALKPDKERPAAPDFTLKDANGKAVRLSDFRGQVVLLDFWATWCDPCAEEIPWFMDLQRKEKDHGLTVLGVSMDDDGWNSVKPFVAKIGINYRVLMGNDETAQLYGGVDALPTTFLIDRQGRIAAVHIGVADRRDIDEGVEKLLAAPQQGGRVTRMEKQPDRAGRIVLAALAPGAN